MLVLHEDRNSIVSHSPVSLMLSKQSINTGMNNPRSTESSDHQLWKQLLWLCCWSNQLMPRLAPKFWILSKVVLAGLCQDNTHNYEEAWHGKASLLIFFRFSSLSCLPLSNSNLFLPENKLRPKFSFLQMEPHFHQRTCLDTVTQNCVCCILPLTLQQRIYMRKKQDVQDSLEWTHFFHYNW